MLEIGHSIGLPLSLSNFHREILIAGEAAGYGRATQPPSLQSCTALLDFPFRRRSDGRTKPRMRNRGGRLAFRIVHVALQGGF